LDRYLALADHGFQILRLESLSLHAEMPVFIGFHQRGQNVEAIAIGSSRFRVTLHEGGNLLE
jgi:hypothetical protein